MSEENVEFVRRGFEKYASGDFEAAIEDFAEDSEWYPYLGLVGGKIYRGREEILGVWRDIAEHLDLSIEPQEFVDLGDKVMVTVKARGVGSESGVGVDAGWVQLLTLHEGKVKKVEAFPDREAALEAAGAKP